MATSPSDPGGLRGPNAQAGLRFAVVGGGTPTPQEVAAIAAALEVVFTAPVEPPPVNRWRWSGRWWQNAGPDWRWSGPKNHPSSP